MDKMARLQALEAELARRKASRAKFENAVAANRASVGDASFINYFQQSKDSEERERLQRVANESEKARQKYEAERIAKANAQTYLDELAKDYYTTSIDLESIPDGESSARAKTERYLDYIREKAEKLAAEHGLSLPADFASKAKTEPTPKPTDANAVVLKNFLETKKNAGTLTDADKREKSLRVRQPLDLALAVLFANAKDDGSAIRVGERAVRWPEVGGNTAFRPLELDGGILAHCHKLLDLFALHLNSSWKIISRFSLAWLVVQYCFAVWETSISTSSLPDNRSAMRSAKYTERCCPPVQPKDT